MPAAPVIGFPEKFELALRYGEGRMAQDVALSDSDKLLLDALAKQATVGPCTEPRPSMFDAVAKARWQAWVSRPQTKAEAISTTKGSKISWLG